MFPAEEIPETIGSYRIVRRLSPSGPAEVYLARNEGPLGFARECELKLLPDTSDGSAEFAEELAREAAICARMNHPAVVRVFDFFEHQGKLVLALEHVEGTSLGELLQWLADHRQKLGDAAVYYVGARIAGAIADAHAATDEQGQPTPIVHRNLTPDSVLVSVDGEVRLTGFGVGKIVGRTPDTAIGKIKGTPGFMAPEQARGEPVTTKADVYGIGLLLWSLLAGRRPPTDGTWPRRVSGLKSDLPREVAAVIDAALDHFPGTRKITAREIEQWLNKAAPPAKGKAELKERVAAMRGEARESRDSEAPPPSRRMPSPAEGPYQGVRFGPAPQGGTAARAARRAPEPRAADPRGSDPQPQRTTTGTALARVVLALPPPPPPDPPPPEPPHPPRFGTPPPTEATPIPAPRFGAPPRPTPATERTPEPPIAPAEPPIPIPPAPSLPEAVAAPEVEVEPEPPPAAPPPNAALPKSSLAPPAQKRLPAAVPRPSILGMQPPPSLDAAPEPELHAASPVASAPSTARPPRKPGSMMVTIAVSATTASVVAIGIYLFFPRGGATPNVAPSSAPVAVSIAGAGAAPPPPPPPTASAAASASAEPDASAPPASANPADLPYGFGYLTVVTPATANVYLSGKIAGPVNQPLKVRCGRWFVRLAAPPESRYPEWVSHGETVVVACQQATRVDMSAPK